MKKLLFLLLAAICCSCSALFTPARSITASTPVTGVVIYDGKFGYHIVETKQKYVIVEWFGGPDFSKGDRITGNLHSFGNKKVTVNDKEKESTVYIEDFFVSKDACYKWMKKNGKLR